MIDEGYVKCIEKMMRGAITWLRKHGTDGLEFMVPPENVMLFGDLPDGIPRIAKTDQARQFLLALEAAAAGQATAFQALLVIRQLNLPRTIWTEKEYAGLTGFKKGSGGDA